MRMCLNNRTYSPDTGILLVQQRLFHTYVGALSDVNYHYDLSMRSCFLVTISFIRVIVWPFYRLNCASTGIYITASRPTVRTACVQEMFLILL